MAHKMHNKTADELRQKSNFQADFIHGSPPGIEISPDIGKWEVHELKQRGYELEFTTTSGICDYDRVLLFSNE